MIITDENLLRLPCDEVIDSEIASIRESLEKELDLSAKRGYPGIGLAAPQIGIYKKFAIIRLPDCKLDLVNCKIVNQFDKFIFYNEGCLSFPDRLEKTERYKEVVINGNTVFPNQFILTGLAAVVASHELDHVNQILLPDRAIKTVDITRKKPRPNDPCSCKSGKKYKICCGK